MAFLDLIMCIENKYIYNNSKLLNINQFIRLKQPIKCGKCFECKEQKSKAYTYRAYHEALETFKYNGYILWDCLSYAPEHVPHVNKVLNVNTDDDFTCFDNKDIVNFMKRLRIFIQRNYGKEHQLKYMITSEYGTAEEYKDDKGYLRKGTHRPHYHLLLFYHSTGFNSIAPETLSVIIHYRWGKGHTDGVLKHGIKVFNEKKVFRETTPHCLNALSYIVKYTEKDSSFEDTINERCNKIINEVNKVKTNDDSGNKLKTDYINTYYGKKEVRRIKHSIMQYNRISNNFGISALDREDLDKVFNTNIVKYPSTKKIFESIVLPDYYTRKLYKSLIYYNIGTNVYSKWIDNEKGRERKKVFYQRKWQDRTKRLFEIYFNSDNKEVIRNLMNGRDFKDLAYYEQFIQNRMCNQYGELPNKDNIWENMFTEDGTQLYNYTTPSDRTKYGNMYTCRKPIENVKLRHFNETKNFVKHFIITDKIDKRYENFDKILVLLHNSRKRFGLLKQNEYEETKRLRAKSPFK